MARDRQNSMASVAPPLATISNITHQNAPPIAKTRQIRDVHAENARDQGHRQQHGGERSTARTGCARCSPPAARPALPAAAWRARRAPRSPPARTPSCRHACSSFAIAGAERAGPARCSKSVQIAALGREFAAQPRAHRRVRPSCCALLLDVAGQDLVLDVVELRRSSALARRLMACADLEQLRGSSIPEAASTQAPHHSAARRALLSGCRRAVINRCAAGVAPQRRDLGRVGIILVSEVADHEQHPPSSASMRRFPSCSCRTSRNA